MRFIRQTPKHLKRRVRLGANRSRRLGLQTLEDRRVLATFNLAPAPDSLSPGSLRHAIMEANSNDEDDLIVLAAGNYSLSLSGSGEGLTNTGLLDQQSEPTDTNLAHINDLDVVEEHHSVTIRGAGIGATTLTGGNLDRVFHIHGNVTFLMEDLTISGSRNSYDGGAFLNDGGQSTLRRVALTGNTAAGTKLDFDALTNGGGGAIANYYNSRQNRAGVLLVEDSLIDGNTATDSRGRGGGIYVVGGTVTLRNTTVTNNSSIGRADTFQPSGGGGIMNEATLFIEDSFIQNNTSAAGAGIANNGGNALEITGTVISNNTVSSSSGGGGAIYNVGPQFVVRDSYIHSNNGNNTGGAIWIDGGGGSFFNTTIANNQVTRTNGTGGAIHNDGGRLNFENVTISGNVADDTGAVYMNGGYLNMTFSTVVNNNSRRQASRGAFLNLGATEFIIDHSIIANNRFNGSALSGWENEIQGGGHLIYNGTPAVFFSNKGTQFQNINLTQTGAALNLDVLADNGGPAPTHALLDGSVAIEHGSNAGGIGTNFPAPPPTDARGVTRPQGSNVDVGAFEFAVPNNPPIAEAGGPYTAALGSTSVSLSGAGSVDTDPGDSLTYAWDIDDDGQFDDSFSQNPTFSLASMGINVAGGHTVRLRVTDSGGLQATDSATLTVTSGAVAGRWAFYNNSFFDGNNPAATAADDGAIATDKQALLPGGTATTANVTSYSRGINGIMVDIAGSTGIGAVTASDFTFRVGNSHSIGSWSLAPAPANVAVRAGAGTGGSARVTIVWPDRSIDGEWLEVTVKANARTGLGSPDMFYFGNAVGDSMNHPTNAAVNGTDFNGARVNTHTFIDRATRTDAFDFNRDSLVNLTDLVIVRDNATTLLDQLVMIMPPASLLSEGEARSAPMAPPVSATSESAAITKPAARAAPLDAYDADASGEAVPNQELFLLAAAENDPTPCLHSGGDLESALDLIVDDLLSE